MSAATEADWLGVSQRAAAALEQILRDAPTTGERVEETGEVGEGGDRTLVIDADAEQAVFDELEALHREGHRFTAVSEERGEVDFGDPGVRVVIDPIDGSVNAKRGLPHHAISIAVADGPTMADVAFGFVFDYGPRESFWAHRGGGAFCDGRPLSADVAERRSSEGKLELIGIESSDPRTLALGIDAVAAAARRIRVLGVMAVSLCQVAAARFDAMASIGGCRAPDVAAGQLIVREAGGEVDFPGYPGLGAPLDVHPHAPILAARSPRALADVRPIPQLPVR